MKCKLYIREKDKLQSVLSSEENTEEFSDSEKQSLNCEIKSCNDLFHSVVS